MTKLVIDEALLAKLHGGEEILEICLPDGRLIGHFWPKPDIDPRDLDPQISEEELNERAKQRDGRTLDEILARLASMS
jgi:hypothetical protein